jgi:hypothetical protein
LGTPSTPVQMRSWFIGSAPSRRRRA